MFGWLSLLVRTSAISLGVISGQRLSHRTLYVLWQPLQPLQARPTASTAVTATLELVLLAYRFIPAQPLLEDSVLSCRNKYL